MLVIGGGVSGLTAAVELVTINPSLRVAVLEAKTRVGGRTLTSTMLGAEGTMPCDLGGQWLGSSQPHILKLLERLDLKTYPQWASGTHIVQLNDGVPRTFTGAIPYTVGIATTLSLGWLQVLLNRLQLRLTLGSAPMSVSRITEEFNASRSKRRKWCRGEAGVLGAHQICGVSCCGRVWRMNQPVCETLWMENG